MLLPTAANEGQLQAASCLPVDWGCNVKSPLQMIRMDQANLMNQALHSIRRLDVIRRDTLVGLNSDGRRCCGCG